MKTELIALVGQRETTCHERERADTDLELSSMFYLVILTWFSLWNLSSLLCASRLLLLFTLSCFTANSHLYLVVLWSQLTLSCFLSCIHYLLAFLFVFLSANQNLLLISGSDGNERVLYIPQSSSITGTSPSDCLESYPGHPLGEVDLTLLQRIISRSTLIHIGNAY